MSPWAIWPVLTDTATPPLCAKPGKVTETE
jgi:hypothetical protein